MQQDPVSHHPHHPSVLSPRRRNEEGLRNDNNDNGKNNIMMLEDKSLSKEDLAACMEDNNDHESWESITEEDEQSLSSHQRVIPMPFHSSFHSSLHSSFSSIMTGLDLEAIIENTALVLPEEAISDDGKNNENNDDDDETDDDSIHIILNKNNNCNITSKERRISSRTPPKRRIRNSEKRWFSGSPQRIVEQHSINRRGRDAATPVSQQQTSLDVPIRTPIRPSSPIRTAQPEDSAE
eukprot:scaffold8673_cov126-Cylindrotheca_fusiformis.AAC.3